MPFSRSFLLDEAKDEEKLSPLEHTEVVGAMLSLSFSFFVWQKWWMSYELKYITVYNPVVSQAALIFISLFILIA